MSIFSNREVAEKFFNIYFKALGPKSMDLTEKKFITLYEGGDVVFPLPSTLPSQLATTASSQTMWSFFGDLLSKVLGGGLSTAVDIAITYGKKLMQESSDFIYDSYVEWNVNVAKDVVLDAVTKGEIDISKSRISAAVEQIVKDFVFPDFQEKDVFSFVRTELIAYRDLLVTWEREYRGKIFYKEITSSLDDINKILAHDAQYTEEQKRAMLEEPYAEFIRSYTTVDDFYKETVDKIIDNIAASVKERWGAEGEYTFWNGKADFLFRKHYSGGRPDEVNGLKDGRMAAFRQIYSSAMWYLSKLGQGWAEEKWTEFKRREWGNDVGLGRMDVWNAQVGRMLGAELCRDPELRKLGLDSLKFKELAGAKAMKLANAALEAGVGASNIGDPRLKLLTGEDLYTGLRFMETDAKEILTSVLGGVSARGESLIGMLEKHMAQGNSEQELNWTGMMDRILKDSTFLMYQNIGENNVYKGESKRISPDEAHLYMQLINWSALGHPPPGVGFDPKNDPFPEDPDARDEELKSSFDRVGGFTEGMLKGSIFKSEKHGFFVVFDDRQGKVLEGIRNARMGEGIEGVIRHFIDPAYRVYRSILKEYRSEGITSENLTLMGYSGGGAVASALSAALHMGAFTEDSATGAYGHYDGALAAYGWSLDSTGKVIDNYPAKMVHALTFNALPMGWFFQKPKLQETDPGNGVYNYRFVYPEGKGVEYLEGVKEAPVTNFGMVEDKYFSQGRPKFRIGKNEYLFKEDGKLPYVEGAIDWHDLDTLELAFQEAPKQEEDPEKPGEGPRKPDDGAPRSPSPEVRQDPLILDLNRDGKVSTTPGKRYFDLDANGVAERVSWAASGDGFLAMDRDGDGKITSGRELFGDHTVMSDGRVATSGFQALADLDSNKDGKIDASDEEFGRLRVWSDKDGNGKFEDHELSTLEEAGIESIDLRYSDHRTEDENGNQIVRTGRFTWKDGDRGKVSEFLLERDTIHSLAEEKLDEPDEVAALPDLPQRGFLYSLHQAMVRDGSGELRKLTERFAEEKDSVTRRSLLDRILLKWSEVSNVETTPNGGWLGFLEKFYGARYDWSSLTERGRRQLESAYESVSLYLYGNLLRQSHYADELKMLDYDMDDTGRIFLSTRRALESLAREHAADPDQLKRSLGEFFLVLKTAGLYEYVDESEVESHAALLSTYGSELPDVCRASYLAMKEPVGTYMLPYFVSGRGGTLDGDIHSNVLVGSEEADILRGGHGSDVLMGGRGSDTLVGGEDGDTYVWNLGDGDDRIVNSSTGSGEEDVLRLGKGDDTLKLCA